MANDAALFKHRTMKLLLASSCLREIGMTVEARTHRPKTELVRIEGRVRTVAPHAPGIQFQCSVWNCRLREFLFDIRVATQTIRPARPFHQRDLPFLGLSVADIARAIGEGRVSEVVNELLSLGAVRVVTFGTSAIGKRLILVRLLQPCFTSVVTAQAQVGQTLHEMEFSFRLIRRLAPVSHVAGRAPHIHRSVQDRFLNLRGNLTVAAQA